MDLYYYNHYNDDDDDNNYNNNNSNYYPISVIIFTIITFITIITIIITINIIIITIIMIITISIISNVRYAVVEAILYNSILLHDDFFRNKLSKHQDAYYKIIQSEQNIITTKLKINE